MIPKSVLFEELGARLRRMRREARLRQGEIARELGVHPKTVSKWEHGVQTPGAAHLERLAGMLGVTTRVLLYGEALAGSAFYVRKLEKTASSLENDAAAAVTRGSDGTEPSPPRAVIVRTLEFIAELARAGVPQSKLRATAYLLTQPELFRIVGALEPFADQDPFVHERLETLLRCVRAILAEPSRAAGPL